MWTTYPNTQPPTQQSEPSGQHQQKAQGYSIGAFLLATGGSVVSTIITGAFGSGKWEILAAAAVGPLIASTFSTKRSGVAGLVRGVTVVVLTACSLLITVTGFTFADALVGKSVLSGLTHRSSTFPVPINPIPPSPTPQPTGPALRVQPTALDCGTTALGNATPCTGPVTITSIGRKALHITSTEVIGSSGQDFSASQGCAGKWLNYQQTCDVQISFQPTASGPRQAILVIHQNLPLPDHGTSITLTGVGSGGPTPTPTPTSTPTPTPTPTLSPTPTPSSSGDLNTN